jgi:Lrp/AsnC family leucine-responsive transcriptional regulator
VKYIFDAQDVRILSLLQEDARVTLAEIGRRIHMSQPAVTERVRRMEQEGVITGYHATIDTEALGYGISAFVRIAQRTLESPVLDIVRDMPEVVECHSITGEDCVVVKVVAPSVRALEAVISRLALGGVTSTSLVLSSPIARRTLLPVQAA